jgi:hypothetical protein
MLRRTFTSRFTSSVLFPALEATRVDKTPRGPGTIFEFFNVLEQRADLTKSMAGDEQSSFRKSCQVPAHAFARRLLLRQKRGSATQKQTRNKKIAKHFQPISVVI